MLDQSNHSERHEHDVQSQLPAIMIVSDERSGRQGACCQQAKEDELPALIQFRTNNEHIVGSRVSGMGKIRERQRGRQALGSLLVAEDDGSEVRCCD
jgi:hypothetical protein